MKLIIIKYFSIVGIIAIGVQSTWTMEHVPAIFKDLPRQVQNYLEHLPKITQCTTDNPKEKSKIITDYLLAFGGYSCDSEGRDTLENKILGYLSNNEPIRRCMPGFPVASNNPNKIPFDNKHAFSLGDLVALLTQNHISCEIGKIHKPGSSLTIYWEPFIYELNQICQESLGYPQYPNERIDAYQNTLKDIVAYLEPQVQIGKLTTGTLDEIYRQRYAEAPISVDDHDSHNYEMFIRQDLNSDMWLERAEFKCFDKNREKLESTIDLFRN